MHNKSDLFHCYSLSENAMTIEFGQDISETLLQKVMQTDALVHLRPFQGFLNTVPSYASLTIFFDPVLVISSDLKGMGCFEKISAYVINLLSQAQNEMVESNRTVTIPVCYGNNFGPDIEEVANHHQISIDEVVRLHSHAIYKVYMIGFLPGFAYMGGMSAQLATPRKATPRKVVPAGSVGIAGQQTGIYPLQSPGGWQLIGQTPLKLFDINNPTPILLKAGDNVIFKPITFDEFKMIAG